MRRRAVWLLLLPLTLRVAGQASQVVVTIAIGYCPSSSSAFASLSTLIPGYSTNIPGYGSMTAPSVLSTIVVGSGGGTNGGPGTPTMDHPAATTTTSSHIATPTSSNSLIEDQYGQVYRVTSNTGLSGLTIEPEGRLRRERQSSTELSQITLEDCVEGCTLTSQCVAVVHMGSTCVLYASVSRTLFLLRSEAAFNIARFTGFTNETITTIPPLVSSSTMAVTSQQSITTAPLSSTFISFSPTTATDGYLSAETPSSSDGPPEEPSSKAVSSSLVQQSSSPATVSLSTLALPSTSTSAAQYSSTKYSFEPSQAVSSSSVVSTAFSVLSSIQTPFISSITGSSPSVPGLPVSSFTTTFGSSSPSVNMPSLVRTTSQASSPAVPSSSTSPSYTCPTDSGMTVTDVNGIQYNLMCNSDTYGIDLGQGSASESFNDCFQLCDGAATCAGFTYLGAAEGEGPGNCYFKQGFMYFSGGGSNVVAAIRVLTQASASSLSTESATSLSGPATSNAVHSSLMTSDISAATPSPATSQVVATNLPTSSSQAAVISSSFPLAASSTTSTKSSTTTVSSPYTVPYSLSTTTKTTTTTTTTSSSSSSSSNRPSSSPTLTAATYSSPPSSAPSTSTTSSSLPMPSYVRNNGKRGLCYTNGSYTLPYSLAGQSSQVSWGYDYFYSPYTDSSHTINPVMTFIPLLFNDVEDLAQAWPMAAQAAIDGGADALMSFNEPDLCYSGSACMTVAQSVAAFKRSMMPFAGQARLGAPAVTNGGYPLGLTYLSWFLGNCTDCQVDFINLHWYSNIYAFSYLQYYVQQAYEQFHLPIWLTEFGIDSSGGTDAQIQGFLQQALPWLDAVPYVERYAYFYDGPGYLINADGTDLSARGMLYNSYTAPCANWTNSQGHC